MRISNNSAPNQTAPGRILTFRCVPGREFPLPKHTVRIVVCGGGTDPLELSTARGVEISLLALESFRSDLICPRCQGFVLLQLERCPTCSLVFPQVDGKPVLVDFEYSVIDPASLVGTSAGSLIPRAHRGLWSQWVLRLLEGENRVARAQARTFLQLARKLAVRPRILVVGGASVGNGMSDLYTLPDIDLIGFDIYASENVQIVADAHSIPLRNQCIDGVIIQAVLEHVIEPHRVVSEIQRVLRPGGVIYADTPFLQQVHEGAYDFCRFTENGHRYLFKDFDECSSGTVAGIGKQMVWSVDYLFRGLFRSRVAGRMARVLFFWLRWLDVIIPADFAVDGASSCYFLGTLTGHAITPKELIKRYKGAQ